jgi:hypothetical protein
MAISRSLAREIAAFPKWLCKQVPRLTRAARRVPGFERLEKRKLLALSLSNAIQADPPVVAAAGSNLPPVLADLLDQSIPWSQDKVDLPLVATDPDPDDTLTFTATSHRAEFYLDQRI